MNITEILNWRYATKIFDTEKKISDPKIEILLNAINLTPTSYGLQPFKIILTDNQNLIADLAQASFGQKNVLTASHLIIFAARTEIDENYIQSHVKNLAEIRKTDINSLEAYTQMLQKFIEKKSDEQIQKWASDQCYIALGNLLTVCAAEQIDACPIGGFEPEKFDQILNLQKQKLKSTVFATIGYRDQNDKYAALPKVRRPLSDILIKL